MTNKTVIPRSITSSQLQELAARLDAMSHGQRVAFVRAATGKTQAKLWAAAAGRRVALNDLVPEDLPAGTEAIHLGKNSLPLFSHFEKRFCRSADQSGLLFGYNEGVLRRWIGPGYFLAHTLTPGDGICVDYRQVPPSNAYLPHGWPPLQSNDVGAQRAVFGGMIDHLRRISSHVVIGRAEKHGKATANYFILCRADR
jgi:hypothetical protein